MGVVAVLKNPRKGKRKLKIAIKARGNQLLSILAPVLKVFHMFFSFLSSLNMDKAGLLLGVVNRGWGTGEQRRNLPTPSF